VLNPLPPSEKRKQFELRALGLRDFAGIASGQPLDPFALAKFAKLLVVDFDTIEGLSPESRAHLLGEAADEWSGGACSRPLPNGWRLVILNPAHGKQRNRATLMEEVAHVFSLTDKEANDLFADYMTQIERVIEAVDQLDGAAETRP